MPWLQDARKELCIKDTSSHHPGTGLGQQVEMPINPGKKKKWVGIGAQKLSCTLV